MSYNQPYINTKNPLPIGVEAVIEALRLQLIDGLPWLEKAFGRAWEFKEESTSGRTIRIPKCYTESGEYINVLPNDNLVAQCFFQLNGSETYSVFNYAAGSMKEVDLSVIFWMNLKRIDETKDYIFTEELKADVEEVLKNTGYTKELVEWVDERAEDVFIRYDVDDVNTQYLMYPYAGFRVTVTVNYPENCSL